MNTDKTIAEIVLEEIILRLGLSNISSKERAKYLEMIEPVLEQMVLNIVLDHLSPEDEQLLNSGNVTEEQQDELTWKYTQDPEVQLEIQKQFAEFVDTFKP